MEIERKFLVDPCQWCKVEKGHFEFFRQGYLANGQRASVRVRIFSDKAYLTVKGHTQGISRHEFEYCIPLHDGVFLLNNLAGNIIEKTRYYIDYCGRTWEVDEFMGDNAGLIIAEAELRSEDEHIEKPEWAGTEVSHDARYLNSNLAINPYKNWKSSL